MLRIGIRPDLSNPLNYVTRGIPFFFVGNWFLALDRFGWGAGKALILRFRIMQIKIPWAFTAICARKVAWILDHDSLTLL
jgi:hypothetical protein